MHLPIHALISDFLTFGGWHNDGCWRSECSTNLPFAKTNWNTDFAVNQPYTSFKLFFTADSADAKAKYPVEGFMKFSDGTSLQVINENMSPPVGTGRMFGPFAAVPGKQTSQINFKVGDSSNPAAIGFSYRISVQGCR
jgi:hypothetical protein